MVNANHDSTEIMIRRMTEGIQRMIGIHKDQGEEEKEKRAVTKATENNC